MTCILLERLKHLKGKGFQPKVIYDVGAFVGGWTQDVRTIFSDSQFYTFEANRIHEKSLKTVTGEDKVFIGVLGAENKPVTFYSLGDTGDSIMKENTSYFMQNKNVDVSTRNMRMLDDVVADGEVPLPDLVKLDLQGAELEVIKGGLTSITYAEIIILEVKILEYNIGGPTFLQTINYLDSIGYIPLDITELHYLHTGELNEVDIIFCKKSSSLYKTGMLQ